MNRRSTAESPRVGLRTTLSPRWGLSVSDFFPRLTPWAAFLTPLRG